MRRSLLALAVAAVVVTLPAASQTAKVAPVNLYIDVSTQSMAGMPDFGGMLGGLGGMMARRMGGEAAKPVYPTTRGAGGLGGQYLDMALSNTRAPGATVQDAIPAGLNLGKSLTLVPIELETSNERPSSGAAVPDVEIRISEYWGCGQAVRAGQPKTASFKVKGGTIDTKKGMQGVDFEASGSLSKGLFVPDRDIDVQPGHVYWPNRQHGKQVPANARLAGEHRISGEGIPASMQFQVAQSADFLPKIGLRSQGEPAGVIQLGWPSVDRARAYFITGMKMQMRSKNAFDLVIWSSADVPGAGSALHTYLTGGKIDQWVRQKVLLPESATSCSVPKGIFAGGSSEGGMIPAVLMMTAYGPEHWVIYPPKPADPKAAWNPEWSVRMRAKSSTMSMLGLNLGGMGGQDDGEGDGDQQQAPKRPGMKGLLKGILGG